MALRIVIDNAVLRGSPQEQFWQRVATAYTASGEEYRVYAPPKATGSALGWAEHFSVRQLSDSGMGENYIEDGFKYSVINQVKEELEDLDLDADIWKDVNSQGRYCAAQICLNGHSQSVDGQSFQQGAHCQRCGQPCIDRCKNCKAPIHGKEAHFSGDYVLPMYCYKCGSPYPWVETNLAAATALIQEFEGLGDSEKEALTKSLPDLMRDVPASEVAVVRFKKYLPKAGAAVYSAFKDVIISVATEEVKKKLFGL
jgi:hypothetical protein